VSGLPVVEVPKRRRHLTDRVVLWFGGKEHRTLTVCKERCSDCLMAELLIMRLNGKKEETKVDDGQV